MSLRKESPPSPPQLPNPLHPEAVLSLPVFPGQKALTGLPDSPDRWDQSALSAPAGCPDSPDRPDQKAHPDQLVLPGSLVPPGLSGLPDSLAPPGLMGLSGSLAPPDLMGLSGSLAPPDLMGLSGSLAPPGLSDSLVPTKCANPPIPAKSPLRLNRPPLSRSPHRSLAPPAQAPKQTAKSIQVIKM